MNPHGGENLLENVYLHFAFHAYIIAKYGIKVNRPSKMNRNQQGSKTEPFEKSHLAKANASGVVASTLAGCTGSRMWSRHLGGVRPPMERRPYRALRRPQKTVGTAFHRRPHARRPTATRRSKGRGNRN